MDVSFFDRTARGRLIVAGKDRKDLLHRLATSPLFDLKEGQGTAACFCTPKGKLIDWAVVVDRGEDMLILSANPERLSGHIQQYTITEDVTVRNYMAIEVVVCGPGAAGFVGVELEPWSMARIHLAEVRVEVVRIEPLQGEAYVLLVPDAVALRQLLAERGRSLSPPDVDLLRIRAGIPAHPNEINEKNNPWEVNLGDHVSLRKGCYVGQEVIARLHAYDKVKRRLVALRLEGMGREGEDLLKDGEVVGVLTTVAGGVALGTVDVEWARPGVALDGATVIDFADA